MEGSSGGLGGARSGPDFADLAFAGFFVFLGYMAWDRHVRPHVVGWLERHGLTWEQLAGDVADRGNMPSTGRILDVALAVLGLALLVLALRWRRDRRRGRLAQ